MPCYRKQYILLKTLFLRTGVFFYFFIFLISSLFIKSAEDKFASEVKSHVKSRAKLKEKEETESSLLEEAKKNLQSLKDVKNSTKLKIDKMEKTHAAALKSIKEEHFSRIAALENSLKIRNKNNSKHEEKIKVLQEEVATLRSTISLFKVTPTVEPSLSTFSELSLDPSLSNASLPVSQTTPPETSTISSEIPILPPRYSLPNTSIPSSTTSSPITTSETIGSVTSQMASPNVTPTRLSPTSPKGYPPSSTESSIVTVSPSSTPPRPSSISPELSAFNVSLETASADSPPECPEFCPHESDDWFSTEYREQDGDVESWCLCAKNIDIFTRHSTGVNNPPTRT